MPEKEYDYLEQALPGFSKARLIVKTAGDSIRPLGFKGNKFDFYRFANRFRLATSFQGMNLEGFTEETSLGARRVVATEGGPIGRALREQVSTNDHLADRSLGDFITDFIRSDFDRRL